jgi:hypothetical protein
MLLNVLKGAYPSLQQISKDHVIEASAQFERGTCLVEKTETSGADSVTKWAVAGVDDAADKTKVVHFALQGSDDYQALMAGNVSGTGYVAKVTAISCLQPMEIETDMFVGDDLKAGDYLMVGANGKLVKHTTGKTAVLQVTKAPYVRWSNNADATGVTAGFRQGTNVTVIAGRTVFLPALA